MPIITVAEARTFLGITDRDDLIDMLIPEVEGDYLLIRNAPFDTRLVGSAPITVYPAGSKKTAAQMIGFILDNPTGATSESLGGHSISYGEMVRGYPKAITDTIDKFVGVK